MSRGNGRSPGRTKPLAPTRASEDQWDERNESGCGGGEVTAEQIKFAAEVIGWGIYRAVMLEGPRREAIE